MSKTTVKSFVKQFAAMLTGDSAQVQAEKNYRRADSALRTHIANLEGKTIGLEDRLEAAEEHCSKALVNEGNAIVENGRDAYVQNMIDAENARKKA